ncbi:uncharacterized protein LOC124864845 [Girardinichthys multiradiatus]|uniref:uncharacterized protein LOC124863466 n=1 Tax=Girardinichthys multiradiatus TaxID=208333 RepID=UPI001FAD452A|nr:uncharacterized protein LOC124863466 [Girardinichthys multiradiatus]XP_047215738.1 uncharacterized protein LOC124864845 [Girardinichthys multiradiatus]
MSALLIPSLVQLSAAMEELEKLLEDLNNRLSWDSPASSVRTLFPVPVGGSQRVHRRKRLRGVQHSEGIRIPDERSRLMKLAVENCTNQTVLTWLRVNSESDTFTKLVDMFNLLKTHIVAEEKKNHRNTVDITFVAHGSIGDFMIPASCLLPLASIRDVVLYSPWNCVTCGLAYGIASGRLKPEHRIFYCSKKDGCTVPDQMHRPKNLPDHWNSMKKAGDQMIPNITVSPLRPDDGVWKSFESLTKKHGSVGRNRIVIPFILPGKEAESFPFSVVTLALSLVLLQSRFKATVHLDACLSDRSVGQKLERSYLDQQYACAIDSTGLAYSPEMFSQAQLNSPGSMK